MNHTLGFMIESMVAILLLLTILYCVRLSRQLRLLRADEQSIVDHHAGTDAGSRPRADPPAGVSGARG